MTETGKPLSDRKQRQMIDSRLDTSMLVEAAAGAGKTTKIIDRMIALLEANRCSIDTMAAITFTRKAAAEMRNRFQTELEKRARSASGERRERLRAAADNAGACYIGTIHSFCARLLRERPVESGVPLEFRQIEDDEDNRLRLEAWDGFCGGLYADDDPVLDRMSALGMDPGDLRDGFIKFADYPDVENWPCAPDGPLPHARTIRTAVWQYHRQIQDQVLPSIEDPGNDKLLQLYLRLPFYIARTDWEDAASVERLLEKFDGEKAPETRKTPWPGGNKEERDAAIEAEKERWRGFRDRTARPYLKRLYEHRYAVAMEVFFRAREQYDRLRMESSALNFQDLLMRSAALLREGGPHIRRYFLKRYTHLLVDEFQDTDPVQAEVMMLLASDDPDEGDWRECTPRPGSLFIVGDPKQSIYRFRRADLVTYNAVRAIIARSGGKVISLSSNFRSLCPVLDWVNRCFEDRFPPEADEYSPDYVHLSAGHDSGAGESEPCVEKLTVNDDLSKKNREQIVEYESGLIAGYIHRALTTGMMVRCPKEGAVARPVRPSDFMIVTWKKANMSRYAEKLDQLGIPNAVTGGTVLNDVAQIRQLHTYMTALVHPHNPVALVAALRGELFGIEDTDLYGLKSAGGRFDWRSSVPERLESGVRSRLESVFDHFRRSHRLVGRYPLMTAIQRIAGGLGLTVMAAASAGGNVQAGSVGKALELLRGARTESWSISAMVDYLGELAASEEPHDGLPARPLREEPVRIMNLHKVKGLQAPIVFLADPNGRSQHTPDFHIDRRRRDGACGFLKLQKTVGRYASATVAQPPQWEEKWAVEESKFADAEAVRLLYVAATRAETRLIISQRTKNAHRSPWSPFHENLAACSELEVEDIKQDSYVAPVGGKREENRATDTACRELACEPERINARKGALLAAGYRKESARPQRSADAALGPGREYGMEWGNLLHTLLEAKMRGAGAGGLRQIAASVVREQEMPESCIGEALEVQEALTGDPNGIFARARRSNHCMTEVPFTFRKGEDGGCPVLLSGVVDLAFYEAGGWVIVDYKTDGAAADAEGRKRLTGAYRPQLANYVLAWRLCTGEEVREAGIFYTAAPAYVRVEPERPV